MNRIPTYSALFPVQRTISRWWNTAALFLVSLLIIAGSQREADAKSKVVVLEFEGQRAETFQEIVEDLASSSVRLVSNSKFRKAKKRIRRFRGRSSDYRKIAKRLDVDAFIEGRVSQKRGKYKLKLRFRGRNGEFVDESITLIFNKTRLSTRDERKLRKRLATALSEIEENYEDEEEDYGDEEDDYRDEEDDYRDEEDEYRDEEDEYRDNEDEYCEEDDEYCDEEGEYGDDEEGNTRNRALELNGGLSFSSRKLQFDFDANVSPKPQGYAGAMVPGLYIDLSVFPAILAKKKGLIGGFGITLLVDRVIKIESKLQGASMALPTTQSRLGVGAVYRYNVRPDKANGPTLRASIQYTTLNFTIDKTNAMGISIPNVDYAYFEPGLAASFPVSPQITLFGGARYYILRSTGEIAEIGQYGAANVTGGEGHVGATFKVLPEVTLNAGARFATIFYTFAGSGSLADRNNDNVTDVSGATDSYLSFFTTAGYIF